MHEEQAFLAAIRAAPADATLRLVYADWLEERGDERGELVRVEEEMRGLPVFSDRYWLLKGRRNELRARAPADWLETMRYGTDCLPLFAHGVPEGWKERWRLIREFVERWHRRPMGDVGGRAEEIREVEARLGRTLPPSLREWVAFAHDVRTSLEHHDVLRDVYQMRDLADHPVVSLMLQVEGAYHFAVRHDDFAIPDPPVYGFVPEFESESVADSVTAFTLCYVMSWTRGAGGEFHTIFNQPADLLRDLHAAFPVQCRFNGRDLFEADNILVWLAGSDLPSSTFLAVEVAKQIPREAIPAFLWECAHTSGSTFGMFIPNEDREQVQGQHTPGADGGDPIPF